MKKISYFAAAFALAASVGGAAAADQCLELAVSVKHAVKADESSVLEIVEKQVAAHPGCACEVVKAAVEETKAEAELVAAIVEAAATTAPEHLRLISQCAVAVAPDALSDVQAVVIRLEPSSGEEMPIDVMPAWNPLDFPGEGVGPSPGTWLPDLPIPVPSFPPAVNPPVVVPPVGTETDMGLAR